jgi:hypothetical protein
VISPNCVCQQIFFTLAVHPGLAANLPLCHLDPLVHPALQRFAAQEPHLVNEPASAASASPRSPSEFPTAPIIDASLSRKLGCDRRNAQTASSLNVTVAMGRILSIADSPAYSTQR